MYNDSLFNAFARSFEARRETDMPIAEYLESCRGDPMRYANAAERILAAIGEPQMIDAAKDPRLGRIFLNRTIRAYPAFAGFYGMEETIERSLAELKPGRELHANVEFYAGVVMKLAGLEPSMFTPTFCVARVVGWVANILEQSRDPKIIRPAARYVGPPPQQPLPDLPYPVPAQTS